MPTVNFLYTFLLVAPFCAAFCLVAFVCELGWRALEQRRRIKELAARVGGQLGTRRVIFQEDGKPLCYVDDAE